MSKATLGILIRNGFVLLGEKKAGAEIGSGKLNGPGGKIEPGESAERCLEREVGEEFGIRITNYQKSATLFCYAGDELFQEVDVYTVTSWEGHPTETDSMFLPEWYLATELPFERMHDADREWLPRLLRGDLFDARIFYREPGKGFERIEFIVHE